MELVRELRGEENMEKASEPDRVIGPDGITIASGPQFDPDRDDDFRHYDEAEEIIILAHLCRNVIGRDTRTQRKKRKKI